MGSEKKDRRGSVRKLKRKMKGAKAIHSKGILLGTSISSGDIRNMNRFIVKPAEAVLEWVSLLGW